MDDVIAKVRRLIDFHGVAKTRAMLRESASRSGYSPEEAEALIARDLSAASQMGQDLFPSSPEGMPNTGLWGLAPPIMPSDLDKVDSAAIPLPADPEPTSRPRRKAPPQSDPWNPERRSAYSHYDDTAGIDPNAVPDGYAEWAEARHDADTGTTKAQRMAQLAETERQQAKFEEDYNRATGSPMPSGLAMNDGYRDWNGWQRGMPIPEAMSDTQRVLANRAAAEAERDARLKPMLDADRRDMQERAQWREENPEDAERMDAKSRERSDDYRKERLLYRMAKQTGKTVEQLRAENPQFQSVGHTRDGSLTQLVKTKNGYEVRETPASTAKMRDDIADRRNAAAQKREDAWRSQMMLAGGRPTGGPAGTKALTTAFDRLSPEQQQEVIQSRMRYGDRNTPRGDEWDRRLDLLRIENEARFKEAEAARSESRDEREKDRVLTREERQAAREADERRYAEERAARELEWKERSRQFDAQQMESQRRGDQQSLALAAQLEQIRNQGTQSQEELALARAKQEAALNAQTRAQQLAEQTRREQDAAAEYGPGAVHILRGDYDTPAAQQAFRAMAARADQTWNGFFTDDARRLDAILVNLGITDPSRRRAIVQEYGINSDIPGQQGRGSILSAWRVAHPEYVAPPQ